MAALRDLVTGLAVRESVRPAVHSASVDGEIVDMRGFDSAMAVVQSGAIAGDGDFTAKLQHSDTTTTGDFADVGSDDLQGSFVATMTENNVESVGYMGNRRYLRVVLTQNSGTSIAAGAAIVLGHPHQMPAD